MKRAGTVRRSMVVVVIVMISIGMVLSFAKPTLSAEKIVKFAQLEPMSGSAAAYGIANSRFVKMFADEVNARGGVKVGSDQYKLEISVYDHRYISGNALDCTKRVIDAGIKFVTVGGGGVMPACQPLLEKNKVLNIANAAGGVNFTNANNPLTFRIMPGLDVMAFLTHPYLAKTWGPYKLGKVTMNDDLGRSCVAAFKSVKKSQNLPIELVVEEYVEGDTVDFTSVLLKCKAAGATVIGNQVRGNQIPLLMKQAYEMGYNIRAYAWAFTPNFEMLVKVGGAKAIENLVILRAWPADQYPTPEFGRVYKAYVAEYGEKPIGPTGTDLYTGMQALVGAIEKAGTLDTMQVAKALRNLKMNTINGPTHFVGETLGFGARSQMSFTLPLIQLKDGKEKLLAKLNYELE